MTDPTIVAMGGGGFSDQAAETPLDDQILELARQARSHPRPHVCFLPTASGDADGYITKFYSAFARRAEATHLALFQRTVPDLERFLLEQDVIYVGGGNTANMLAVWRVHGVDRILGRAWDEGIVLAGRSAGSICWFQGGTTDSFGGLDALGDGLGCLPGRHSPHYDGESDRRPTYQHLIASGALPAGYAVDDGAALVFHRTQLVDVVSERAGAGAYRVESGSEATAVETPLEARLLGQ